MPKDSSAILNPPIPENRSMKLERLAKFCSVLFGISMMVCIDLVYYQKMLLTNTRTVDLLIGD